MENQVIYSSSNNFSREFMKKFNNDMLIIEDIAFLPTKELESLKQRELKKHLFYPDRIVADTIGINKMIKLYKYYKKDYEVVKSLIIFNAQHLYYIDDSFCSLEVEFKKEIRKADIKNMKEICFSYARKIFLINTTDSLYTLENIPGFKERNADLFLEDKEMNNELRDDYNRRILSLYEIVNYIDIFKDIPIDSFAIKNHQLYVIIKNLGYGNFQKILMKYFDTFKKIANLSSLNYFHRFFCYKFDDYEKNFIYAVKEFWCSRYCISYNDSVLPDWLTSLNITCVSKYNTWDEMKEYNDNVVVIDKNQRQMINIFGIENLKRFDSETNYFSHYEFDPQKSLEVKVESIHWFLESTNLGKNLCDKNEVLNYEEFLDIFSKYLNLARIHTNLYETYDFIKGPFRDNHPELFFDENAPEEYQYAFYHHRISLNYIKENPGIIQYLLNKDLESTINNRILTTLFNPPLEYIDNIDFIGYYAKKFGNEELIKRIIKYGSLILTMQYTEINTTFNTEQIDNLIEDVIYKRIVNEDTAYHDIIGVSSFSEKHPELFLDLSNVTTIAENLKKEILVNYYSQNLNYELIKSVPELKDLLKNKNIHVAFGRNKYGLLRIVGDEEDNSVKLISNKDFLTICSIYGKYLKCVHPDELSNLLNNSKTYQKNSDDIKELCDIIEKCIGEECLNGVYEYYGDDVPEFLKIKYPELFLNEDAPEDLKNYFYRKRYNISFKILKKHSNWLPYLENKSVITPFLRNNRRIPIKQYFNLFGDKALQLGIKKSETVTTMINANQVELMKKWYDKTGGKFIPHYVVMQNFPIQEADKFLSSIPYWNRLMKIKYYVSEPEYMEAVLKLAYSFGVFHNDAVGFQKLYNLLTYIPHHIDKDKTAAFDALNSKYIIYNTELLRAFEVFMDTLIEERFPMNYKDNVLFKIYRKNDDGSYTLAINPQKYPKSMQELRNCFEIASLTSVITPYIIHCMFGGFKMEYNKEFREFLLSNIEDLYYTDYSSYISSIQRQFKEIKAINSSRHLTFDLAISYVKSNVYEDVFVGNERMAEISSIAGYSQNDFEQLQKIYNYGRMRVYSSIPRIAKKNEKYAYEILRLDDPLALAIGTLTDCCQEISNAGASCMEHSMIDKNGRVFVIKDHDGNIISQSWVWRNKNVLCFDNIEIPKRAFKRSGSDSNLADEVFAIYKDASRELMEEDEKVYNELLNMGKITKEQYNGLKLTQVTVGLGFNDIANTIKKNTYKNNELLVRPLTFCSVLSNDNYLYTADSTEQYIIEKSSNLPNYYEGDTLAVHSDDYKIYNDTNFTRKDLESFIKMELFVRNDTNLYLEDFDDFNNIVSNIAGEYRLNPDTAKIVMHPNFIIVYDEDSNEIRIGEFLYISDFNNLKEDDNYQIKVFLQIKLALEQISKEKTINMNILNGELKQTINEILNLKEEIDKEKGLILNK